MAASVWQKHSLPRAHHVAHHLISLQKKRNVFSVYSVFSASSPPALLLQQVYNKFQLTTWQDERNHKHQNMPPGKSNKGNLDERRCLPAAGRRWNGTKVNGLQPDGIPGTSHGSDWASRGCPTDPLPELMSAFARGAVAERQGVSQPSTSCLAHDCVALPPFLASKLSPDFSSAPRTTPSTTT